MTSGSQERLLDNLIILGRAAPEEMNDGRQTVCTGAYSPELGFIRLYPINPRDNIFSRWDIVNAEVERNPKDTRHESWKIKGRKRNQREKVEVVGEYPREKRATLLYHLEDDCVNDINEKRRSLGIIAPDEIHGLEFDEWKEDDAPGRQVKLFEDIDEDKPDNRDEFEYNIKLKYTCSGCKTKQGYHNPTLLEWGAYMGMKNTSLDQLADNYRFTDDDYRHWFFVGNMNAYKNSFIVISILWMKKDVEINNTFNQFPKVAPDFEPPDLN